MTPTDNLHASCDAPEGRFTTGRRAMMTFTVAKGPEADCLTTAFYRFIELHGRSTVFPRDHCSLTTLRAGKAETKVVTLWNQRADRAFAGFLARYRAVYGAATRRRRRTAYVAA